MTCTGRDRAGFEQVDKEGQVGAEPVKMGRDHRVVVVGIDADPAGDVRQVAGARQAGEVAQQGAEIAVAAAEGAGHPVDDQVSAGTQQRQVRAPGGAAQSVEDRVDAAGAGAPTSAATSEVRWSIAMAPHPAHPIDLAGARRPDHVQTTQQSHLHQRMADATGGSLDQHRASRRDDRGAGGICHAVT